MRVRRGTNPRSQPLDGLTGEDAKVQRRSEFLSDRYHSRFMPEHGIRSVANAHRIAYVLGEREQFVRAILEFIASGRARSERSGASTALGLLSLPIPFG